MEQINELLQALNNKVPSGVLRRLDGLKSLRQRLQEAQKEHDENPTEESGEKLTEIVDFIEDTEQDLIEDLGELVEKKRKADSEERKKRKEQEELENKKKQEEEEAKQKSEKEKKSGIGWGSLILGGTLLVLSAGAINYFGKRQ